MRVLIARRRSTPPPVSGAGVPNVEASRNDVDRRDGEAMDYQKGVKILVLAAVAGMYTDTTLEQAYVYDSV